MSSQKVIDLRKRKTSGPFRLPLPFGGSGSPRPERKSSLRARRRRVRALIALAVLLVLAGIVYGVSWVSYLPKFSVSEIEIAGAEDISPRLLHAFVETKVFDGSYPFFSRGNILLFPHGTIEKAIVAQFPRIRSAEISRASFLAQAVIVTVEEREPYARWCESPQECYLMDEDGLIFAELATSTDALPTEYIFTGDLPEGLPIGQTYLAGQLAGLRTLLEKFGQSGYPVRSVSAESDQDFSLLLSDGFIVHASFGQDVGVLVRNLELILGSSPLRGKEGSLEYIDLRFGNRVYYKLEGETAALSETN